MDIEQFSDQRSSACHRLMATDNCSGIALCAVGYGENHTELAEGTEIFVCHSEHFLCPFDWLVYILRQQFVDDLQGCQA
jgi:hypothetical protein